MPDPRTAPSTSTCRGSTRAAARCTATPPSTASSRATSAASGRRSRPAPSPASWTPTCARCETTTQTGARALEGRHAAPGRRAAGGCASRSTYPIRRSARTPRRRRPRRYRRRGLQVRGRRGGLGWRAQDRHQRQGAPRRHRGHLPGRERRAAHERGRRGRPNLGGSSCVALAAYNNYTADQAENQSHMSTEDRESGGRLAVEDRIVNREP